jgi:penicillin-binding protein 1A
MFLVLALLAGSAYTLSRIPLPTAPVLNQTTLVYDSAGNQLASFSSSQARVDVSLSQVPQVVIDAILSIEDHHFFTEGAINPVSTLRALINDIRGGSLQGGSTITQQYVKQTYTGTQRTILRKLKEAVLAEKVQRKYTKNQILDDYLNTIYFGRGAYGVEAASEAYFDEPIGDVGLAQASLLAGLIHNPVGDDPTRNPAGAQARQNLVLAAMLRYHKITEAQLKAVQGTPISSYLSPGLTSGIYVNVKDGDQFFVEAVRQQLVAHFGQARVYDGGLRVYTTLDPKLQHAAYNTVYGPGSVLNPAKGTPAGALVSVDNRGAVRAMVGGQNYGKGQVGTSQVNLAMGAQGGGSGRQAGSTFKAFLLAELVKEGYSVQSIIPAPPEVLVANGNGGGASWDVTNYEGEAPPSGKLSIVQATAQSVNTVFAQLVEKIGPQRLVSMAESLGIPAAQLAAIPSLTLGTRPVSPLQMASAFSTFANNGIHNSPVLVTKVTTAGGQVLPFPTSTASTVLTSTQDQVVNYTLQQVVQQGTGGAATATGIPAAGKTGTTDKSSDVWFVGYTPQLTTAVWEGYPNSNAPLPGKAVGGGYPTTLWTDYMIGALRAEPALVGGQSFPSAYSLGGITLDITPTNEPGITFPKGLGTTTTSTSTTSTSSTSSTSTTVPTSKGTTPTTKPVATTPGTTTTTAPAATTTTHPKAAAASP